MKVLFVPVFSNPYQHNLTDDLAHEGVVVLHKRRFPSLLWLLRHRGSVQVIHLHWLHALYQIQRLEDWKLDRLFTPLLFLSFALRLLFAKMLGYSLVWTVHNIMPHDSSRVNKIDRWGRLVMIQLADAMITHCDYGKAEIQRQFQPRAPIHVIQHGFFTHNYPQTMDRASAREELGIDADTFVYLYFGIIKRYKGVDTLIEAFSQLNQEKNLLLLCGRCPSDSERTELTQLAAQNPNVRLNFGFVPDEEVQNYFLAADAVTLPFRQVFTSGSTILSLGFGRPVIVPALGCLPELITEDSGILYDADDPNALCSSMVAVQKRDLSQMNQAAQRLAEEHKYQWRTIAQQTYTVYQNLLSVSQ